MVVVSRSECFDFTFSLTSTTTPDNSTTIATPPSIVEVSIARTLMYGFYSLTLFEKVCFCHPELVYILILELHNPKYYSISHSIHLKSLHLIPSQHKQN